MPGLHKDTGKDDRSSIDSATQDFSIKATSSTDYTELRDRVEKPKVRIIVYITMQRPGPPVSSAWPVAEHAPDATPAARCGELRPARADVLPFPVDVCGVEEHVVVGLAVRLR
jgi:hypothetical protein